MSKKPNFVFSDQREPHRSRTKAILSDHPDMRKLIGKNPSSFFIVLLLVTLQLGAAYLLRGQPWWMILIAAYTVGAVIDHALFVMIHEVAHNLIFKKKIWNTWAGILCNIPQVFPSSVSFKRYHIKHHSFQGVHELDADLPSNREARLVHNSTIGKMLWLLFYVFVQVARTGRTREIKLLDMWVIINIAVQLVTMSAIVYFWGITALIYLIISLMFSVGLHPLGARWIQEHFLTLDRNQETYSYYGKMNTLAMNVGYHNEHHDFPSVPWNKLPDVKAMAPEYYESLKYHTSWTKLLLSFLFNKESSIYDRVIREERGKVPLTDESVYDKELLDASDQAISH